MDKWLMTYGLFPVTNAAQAVTLVDDFKFAMSVAEMKVGKGLCLMSQLEALSRFGTDSVATKYLINLFDYTLGDWNGSNAVEAKLGSVSKNLEFDKKKAFFVNLRPYVNMGFKDDAAHDKKGGWTDQGPKKDMRNIPTGKVLLKGVDFDIIKPEKNGGKSCIVLAGPSASRTKDFLPSKIKNIIVGEKAKKLFFLIAGAWIPVSQRKVAEIDVYYGGGKTQILFSSQTFDIVSSKNIADWGRPGKEIPDATPGWIGPMGNNAAKEVVVYIAEWTNPDPDRVIESISFKSTGMGVPILIAVTGEKL
jgi:beta-galactosidase